MTLVISEILVYPVKALGPISLNRAQLCERGFEHDRRMMLVDENGVFISQREVHGLGLLSTSIRDKQLLIQHERKQFRTLSVPLEPISGEHMEVVIWQDRLQAVKVGQFADDWFSHLLDMKVHLVYMPADSRRPVDPDYASADDIVSFADGYPYLLIGQASLNDLNQRIGKILSVKRFRPNIVFTGGQPFEEDEWDKFSIGNVVFQCAKPCARCQVPTIDPATSEMGSEPLRTLSTYRKFGHKVLFGQNLICRGKGMLSIGDEIEIISRKT